MDKNQAKVEIEKLKQKLSQVKEAHKRNIGACNNHIIGLKKQIAIQSNASQKKSAKQAVDNYTRVTKGSVINVYNSNVKQIQEQIERIKRNTK